MYAKKLLALAVTGVTVAAIAGCSSGGASGTDGDVVTLTYWSGFTGGDKKAYEDLIQQFNDEHDDIQVDYVLQPWDSIAQKLPTSIASGSGPDLATPDYNVATVQQYVANDLALALSDLVGDGDTQVPEGALPETIVDSFSVDDELYAAPANFATLMLYYNKELLDAAGIAVPETMDELRDAAAQLADGNGQYGLAIADHDSIPVWPILLWADGGDIVADGCSALGSPESVEALTSWVSVIRDAKAAPLGASGQDADNLFAAGKAAFEINGPWAAGAYTEAGVDFDVAPVPIGGSGEPVTLGSTVPTIVSASTEHPEEAQEFLAWWLSKTTQAELSTAAAYAPSRTDMADDPAVTDNPMVAAFTAEVRNARLYLPTEADFAEINDSIFVPAIQSATQTGDAAAALESADAQLNELLGCE
jgi:multiple sugar transport system substrate-binding protein